MKSFNQISKQAHDASGITIPNNYMWEKINGIWYPVDEILSLIEFSKDGENEFSISIGDYQMSGTIEYSGNERSYRWNVEMDWFLDDESEEFYDENHELIDQLVYEKM